MREGEKIAIGGALVLLIMVVVAVFYFRTQGEEPEWIQEDAPQGSRETVPVSPKESQWRYREPPRKSDAMFDRMLDEAPLPAGPAPGLVDRFKFVAENPPVREWLLGVLTNSDEPHWWREQALVLLAEMSDDSAGIDAANRIVDWLETTRAVDQEDVAFRRFAGMYLPMVVLAREPSEKSLRFIMRCHPRDWRQYLRDFSQQQEIKNSPHESDSDSIFRRRRAGNAAVLLETFMPRLEDVSPAPEGGLVVPKADRVVPQEVFRNSLTLSVCSEERAIALGEPLFVKFGVRNDGAEIVRLWFPRFQKSLSWCPWDLHVAREGGDYQHVRLRQSGKTFESFGWWEHPLAPGEEIEDITAIWFQADGSEDGERKLVFGRPGLYRFRIALHLLLDRTTKSELTLTSESSAMVGDMLLGFETTITQIKGLGDDLVVQPEHLESLDRLIAESGDSYYAPYLKWLRLRSNLARAGQQPWNQDWRGSLAEMAGRLHSLDRQFDKTCLRRDALIVEGLAQMAQGEKQTARETLAEIDSQFAPSWESTGLRRWVTNY